MVLAEKMEWKPATSVAIQAGTLLAYCPADCPLMPKALRYRQQTQTHVEGGSVSAKGAQHLYTLSP